MHKPFWSLPLWERLPLLSLWMLLGATGPSRGVCVDVLLVLLKLVVSVLVAAGVRGCSVEVLLGVWGGAGVVRRLVVGLTVVAAEVVVGLVVVVVGGAVVLVTAVVLVVAVVVGVVVVDGAAVVVVLGRTAWVRQEINHINSTLYFMISWNLTRLNSGTTFLWAF